ncbi:MAG TPA: fused MFS/spermidine synthase [Pseudomonadales bacterium]|nr:fused MFS/spermidine synthase [Pseudomonadales bacterium]
MAMAGTIFAGAFLLFQVQPMVARFILPWFGGSPAVWTASMLFFQVMLLAGYGYTHLIVSRLTLRRQVLVHLTLLVLSLATLPITPDAGAKPVGGEAALPQILLLLLVTVGMPYTLVSSTAPLLQSWFVRAQAGRSPYGLYALSNLGSLLGLLAYPFVVEPLVGVETQTLLWSGAYLLFVLSSVAIAVRMLRALGRATADAAAAPSGPPPSVTTRILWLMLSALGVVVLLATTNQLCKDVAVIPLLWVVPLSLYLLSFIVAFGRPQWYLRPLWGGVLACSLAAVLLLLREDFGDGEVHLYVQILVYCTVVFSYCMVCHGELFRLRPPTDRLTSFYLTISAGGALGGVLVALVAPLLFLGYWELHVALVAVPALLLLCALRTPPPGLSRRWLHLAAGVWGAGLVVALLLLVDQVEEQRAESIYAERSFYGVLRVYEEGEGTRRHYRSFYHGRIEHGGQYLDAQLRRRPTTYYGWNSGAGVAIAAMRGTRARDGSGPGLRVGLIGLGTGTLATHARPGDSFRFYEIDPAVARIAATQFSYLADSSAAIEVVLGDGRISLEREAPQAFDVLLVDAFSGDGIPVHLLTREAVVLYRSHLDGGGILAIHVSNLHFDLRPVVRALADDAGLGCVWIEDDGDSLGGSGNDWILLYDDAGIGALVQDRAQDWPSGMRTAQPWTDDHAQVLDALWSE